MILFIIALKYIKTLSPKATPAGFSYKNIRGNRKFLTRKVSLFSNQKKTTSIPLKPTLSLNFIIINNIQQQGA